MYINKLDDLFDNTINNFYNFLNEKKAFIEFNKDINFITIQNYIVSLIKEFMETHVVEKSILERIKIILILFWILSKDILHFIFTYQLRICIQRDEIFTPQILLKQVKIKNIIRIILKIFLIVKTMQN